MKRVFNPSPLRRGTNQKEDRNELAAIPFGTSVLGLKEKNAMTFDHHDHPHKSGEGEGEYEAPFGGTPTPGGDPSGYALREDEGSMTWFEGALLTFKAKAADTRGQLSFFQCDVPYGWQAPVHRHANESELFFITEGEWEVLSNDTVHLVRPGGTVWIPAGTEHSIFVRSKRGRGYCVITPGGFERFFELTGEPATVPSMPTHEIHVPTNEELAKVGESMGWELVEPTPRRIDD